MLKQVIQGYKVVRNKLLGMTTFNPNVGEGLTPKATEYRYPSPGSAAKQSEALYKNFPVKAPTGGDGMTLS